MLSNRVKERLARFCRRVGSNTAAFERLKGDRISVSWLQKYACGQRDNPTVDTLDALTAALDIAESRCDL